MNDLAQRGETLLLTGADGLIGTSVARALTQLGYSFRCTAGLPSAGTLQTPAQGKMLYADICDRESLRPLVQGCTTVVHLAGPSSVAESFRAPSQFARIHLVGTATILELCREAGVGRFVYLSSAEVYGRPTASPVTEDAPLAPLSPYGAVKLGTEMLIHSISPQSGMEAVILRPFSVFGPGSPRRSVLGAIVSQAIAGQDVRLQNLDVVRDYCYVDDVAQAIVAACRAELPERLRTFNVSTGQGTSVATLARKVLDILGRDLPVTTSSEADRPQLLDIPTLIGDSRRASTELGWRPRTPLREGLAATIAAWSQERL